MPDPGDIATLAAVNIFSALILPPRSSPGARRRQLLGLPDQPEVSFLRRQIQEVTCATTSPSSWRSSTPAGSSRRNGRSLGTDARWRAPPEQAAQSVPKR